ncbi:tyrosine-type recombinase/integrase [Corallococcus sp. AS-1-12]|uniref:tyrosine-type recombinase/integrase n=1 Tax=Corallococcus sp. AS-1-12 TaxID=2874598 RepID=UPI001CBFBC58|nr:site-specific integrase [Corallococcus sp. AS-1-12]
MSRRKPSALAGLIESFFRQRLAAQRRASPATIATYRDALRLLLVFAAEKLAKPPVALEVKDLDRDLVLAFLDFLEKKRGNSVRSRNARLAAIRSFFRHVTYADPSSVAMAQRILSIPGKRATRKVVSFLNKEEVAAVLATMDRATAQGRRDHAMVLFLVRTGARVSEAIAIDVGDLRLATPTQVLMHGKGSKDRVVPLLPELATTLQSFVKSKPRGQQRGPLFTNSRGERLTRWGVNHILARAVNEAAAKAPSLRGRSVTPHLLRHTTAMDMLQSGVDLTTIRSVLGHASEETTHHYVEANTEMKRAALAKGQHDEAAALDKYEPPDELLALLEKL